jgi:uncharacterized protein (DUF2384 family)
MGIKRFEYEVRGQEVIRMESGRLICSIPVSIPDAVIEQWLRRIDSYLARRIGHLRHAERRGRSRRLIVMRASLRARKVVRRARTPLRKWSSVPRR